MAPALFRPLRGFRGRNRQVFGTRPQPLGRVLYSRTAYEQLGRFPEALAVLTKSQQIFDSNPSLPLAEKARVYALSGRRGDALQTLDRLLALSKRTQVSKYPIAAVYAALGDKGQAFAYLNRAYDEHSFMLGFLRVDPALDPLRSDPRFRELLRRMELQ